MKKIIKWVLIAFVALIVIAAVFGDGADKNTPPTGGESTAASTAPETPKVPAIKVTAHEIAQAYEDNEAAADSQFKDKLLEVSGRVSGVKKDMFDKTVIELEGKNQFIPVQGTLTSEEAGKALSLKKGNKVTLQCKGAGEVASFAMLHDCSIL